MIYFRQTLLHKIKTASGQAEIEELINDSIQRLKIKNVNGHIIQRFIMGMRQALYRERTDHLSLKTLENMDRAIDLFGRLQKP